jgi:hypothetical protein
LQCICLILQSSKTLGASKNKDSTTTGADNNINTELASEAGSYKSSKNMPLVKIKSL